jgi:hypothetical protein
VTSAFREGDKTAGTCVFQTHWGILAAIQAVGGRKADSTMARRYFSALWTLQRKGCRRQPRLMPCQVAKQFIGQWQLEHPQRNTATGRKNKFELHLAQTHGARKCSVRGVVSTHNHDKDLWVPARREKLAFSMQSPMDRALGRVREPTYHRYTKELTRLSLKMDRPVILTTLGTGSSFHQRPTTRNGIQLVSFSTNLPY